MVSDRSRDAWLVLAGVLLLWTGLSVSFILRTPVYAFSHDIREHFLYTHILVSEHRLPHPSEGVETFEPPLFYWLASHCFAHLSIHPQVVRLGSALCGAGALVCIAWVLRRLKTDPLIQFFILLFACTTPAFLFVFSTYNNDALSTFWSTCLVVITLELVQRERPALYIAWTAAATAGLYTKYTVGFVASLMIGMCAVLAWRHTLASRVPARLTGCLIVALALLSPWTVGHNYRQAGRLFPFSRLITDPAMPRQIMLPHTALRTVLTPPGFTRGEWRDPFAHLWEATGHKKGSLLAYEFTSSVFGEFGFGELPAALCWGIIAIHFLFIAGGFAAVPLNGATRLAGFMILGAWVNAVSYVFYFPFAGIMDFRYLTWSWIPLSVLGAAAMVSRPWVRKVGLSLLGVGALLQTIFLRMLMQQP